MDAYVGGVWRSPSSAEVYVGGAWRTLHYGEAYVGGSWRTIVTFVPSLSVDITPTLVSGTAGSFYPAFTNVATATPTGGLGPYTYNWAFSSGVGSVNSSGTTASTNFVYSPPFIGTYYGTFQCTVTDSLGSTASGFTDAEFHKD